MEARTTDFGGIGWAVSHLRFGHRLRRRGWYPAIWVTYVEPGDVRIIPKLVSDDAGNLPPFRNMLFLKDEAGALVPYVASQDDLLASDWEVVGAVQPGEYHATPEQMAAARTTFPHTKP